MKRPGALWFAAFSLAGAALLAQGSGKGALDQAEKAQKEGRYALALECLRQAEASGAASGPSVDALRQAIRQEAKKKLRELLDEAERLEYRNRLTQAIALLDKNALDFPPGRDSQGLLDRLDLLRRKLDKRAHVSEKAQEGPSFPEDAPAESIDLYRKAIAAEAGWQLEEAIAACRAALVKSPSLALAKPFASLAEDVQRQIWCIQALRDSVEQDSSRFQGMEIEGFGKADLLAVKPEGLLLRRPAGETLLAWNRIARETWPKILSRAVFDAYDRCQAAVLLARRGSQSEADRWLAAALEKDPGQKNLIDSILARRRGEEIPNYGYSWFRETWMSFREKEEFRDAAEIERQIALLDRGEEEREKALERLADLGPRAMAPLRYELGKRIDATWGRLRDAGFLKSLARMQAQREELDKRRRDALELIFDEEKYFYPYRPPECPPEKAKLYPAVQAEVDKRVAALREIWENAEALALSKPVRAAIASLQEIQHFADKLGARVGLDDDLYAAALAIDPEDDSIPLRYFCRDRSERAQWLSWNRRILAFNALAANSTSDEEKRQVAATNQYRLLFGRKAVAINEKLEQAARRHSAEMESKGYFSHFSPTPELRTPFDRMKKAGYAQGASENIAQGMSDAEGAHQGWIHSSGHHRNILMPSHREMGSGVSGTMWTQNFGSGKEYEEDPAWTRN